MNIKRKDLQSGIFTLFFSIFLYIISFSIEQSSSEALGPRFFPRLVALLLAGLSIIMLLRTSIGLQKEKRDGKKEGEKPAYKDRYALIGTLMLLVAYALLVEMIGFIIMSAVYLFLQIYLLSVKEELNQKKILINAVISIATPSILYLLFYYFFDIFLPPGVLG